MAKKNPAILGTYKGECADAAITNNNGLDITYEVWDTLFNSDIYKKLLPLGHYIGFLGHPEDPGNQDYKDACIVMTEGHVEDDGKVYGEFNLIDTPVGRVVKAFQDAGVQFGISVRGVGEVFNHSVDPDSFDFRGFDLVTMPAYPNAIPEFTEIAASSDAKKQKRYKKICAAIDTELPNIEDPVALQQIQSMFPEQSDQFHAIEDRIDEVSEIGEEENLEERCQSLEEQVSAMYNLWRDTAQELNATKEELARVQGTADQLAIYNSRKLNALTRICASQNNAVAIMENDLDDLEHEYQCEKRKAVKASKELKAMKNKYRTSVSANTRIKNEMEALDADCEDLSKQLDDAKKANLQYDRKIQSNEKLLDSKDDIIASLETKLSKTSADYDALESETSNLGGRVQKLEASLDTANGIIEEYQDAYASLYASAVGGSLENVYATSLTHVTDLQKQITGSSKYNGSQEAITCAESVDEPLNKNELLLF